MPVATYVAASITHFIASEVGNRTGTPCWLRPVATVRHRAPIATLNIVVVIYMTAKLGMAMKPRASTNEDTAGKPFGAVIAVGSAGVRSVVIVAVGAYGSRSDTNDNLSFHFRSGRRQTSSSNSGQGKTF